MLYFGICIDVALVTSLRDGMNLVSYEYVACQSTKNVEGVLVLSEVSLLPHIFYRKLWDILVISKYRTLKEPFSSLCT